MEAVPLLGSEETEKTEPSVRPSASVTERVPVMMVESSALEPELPEETTAESSTAVTVRLMA